MDPFACHWIDVEFHFEIDLQKWSARNIYKLHQLWYMYIMSTWNTCNINKNAWTFTMNLSKKYSTWTISSNRIHFTRTLYISVDAWKLSSCLHVHEIDTGTKGKDLHPNPISELFEIKKKWGQHLLSSYYWYAWHYFIRYIPP